jgi:hypothetical protein
MIKSFAAVARPLLLRFAQPAKIRRYFMAFHLDTIPAHFMLHMRSSTAMHAR